MKHGVAGQKILLIDNHEEWRRQAIKTLEQEGFVVESINSYEPFVVDESIKTHRPDLIILGCTTIGDQERQLITHILEHYSPLLVLSTSLPWQTMRALFLAGADDVADKPYEPEQLIKVVYQTLSNIDEKRHALLGNRRSSHESTGTHLSDG